MAIELTEGEQLQEIRRKEKGVILNTKLLISNTAVDITFLKTADKITAIVNEDGYNRSEPIIISSPEDEAVRDSIIDFMHEHGVTASLLKPTDQKDRIHISVDSPSFNVALAIGRIEIVQFHGQEAHRISGLDEYVTRYSKEHTFDEKYNPEIEEE